MQYKTILLELLEQYPTLNESLKRNHILLSTVEVLARQLKQSFETWQMELKDQSPDQDELTLKSRAQELAVAEMEDHLRLLSHESEEESLSLSEAMDFINPNTPNA